MPQDPSKTGPRAIKKWCIFRLDFWLVLDSLWGRFGEHFGLQNRPKTARTFYNFGSGFRSCCLMVPRCPQDRLKRALGGVLGRLGEVLGRSWWLLGPLWTVLGWLLGRLEGVLGCSWVLLGRRGAILAARWYVFLMSLFFALNFLVDVWHWFLLLHCWVHCLLICLLLLLMSVVDCWCCC